MVNGESHYFLGRRYRLRVVSHDGPAIVVRRQSTIELRMRDGSDATGRSRLLQQWYRAQLKTLIPPLLEKWRARLEVEVADWGVRQMKTRWGSCNTKAHRICLNLELAKLPPRCIEYVLVHELAHLIERGHGERFRAIMDRHVPQWRILRQELNAHPLAHGTWTY
jgi:predicted metal-dependent hydrolase